MRRIKNCEGLLLAAHGRFDEAFASLRWAVRLDEQIDAQEPVALNNLAFVELMSGRHDDALGHGLEVIHRLRGTRYADALSLALTHVTQAWLEKGDTVQARAAAREGWPAAPRLTHQALWADYIAWLAAAEARPRAAARLAGYADATFLRLQDVRFDSQRPYDEALRLARMALGEAEVQRLMAEGKALSDEQIAPLAFGERDCG